MSLEIRVENEFAPLKKVVLGCAKSMGGTPTLEEAYDPKSKEHIRQGTFPTEADCIAEMAEFEAVLKKYNVEVFRPNTFENYNQIFARDIALVIEDQFIITNMLEDRSMEVEAIQHVFNQIDSTQIIQMDGDSRLEGGDIMPIRNNHIFIGYSKEPDFSNYTVARTNQEGVEFIRNLYPNKTVVAFELNKSDENPRVNALHLDCCFQPLGMGHALIHPAGFKHQKDVDFIREFYSNENLIEVSQEEMYNMGCNVFSIAPNVVVSEKGFTRINAELRKLGYIVEEIKYSEIAKMEGLLRCSTLPLLREY